MNKQEMQKRIWGVLVGGACGDAMGMATEMMSRQDIAAEFPDGVKQFYPASKRDVFGRRFRAGEITDDTINTVLVAQMLIDTGGRPDTMRYLAYLEKWMEENKEKSSLVAGPSTVRALEAIKKGMPIERAGIFGTTNGSAMKISPIGIISDYRDMEQLTDNVEQICRPTHNTSVAIAGATVVAACVSYGVRGGGDIKELWEIVLAAVESGGRRGYPFPTVLLRRRIEAVRELTAVKPKEMVLRELTDFYGTGVETIESIPAALAVIQLAGGNAWEAACLSAELGGDTDTIGAISAAICGGIRPEFPAGTAETLESVNDLHLDELAAQLLPYAV